MRRCQILIASADEKNNAYRIARELGCHDQTARNAIHRFNDGGLPAALSRGSSQPHTVHRAFDKERAERLREMLHKSPRLFGKQSTLWTLQMAAEVSFEEGLTEGRLVSGETIRATLARMGVRWQRAKKWITSPDPEYQRKKGGATG